MWPSFRPHWQPTARYSYLAEDEPENATLREERCARINIKPLLEAARRIRLLLAEKSVG